MLHFKLAHVFSKVISKGNLVNYSLRRNSSIVFDRSLKQRQRTISLSSNDLEEFDYLRKEAAVRLVDRLEDIKRGFPVALDIGCYRGHLEEEIRIKNELNTGTNTGGIELIIKCDISRKSFDRQISNEDNNVVKNEFLVLDEERLPFKDNSFDLVLSSLAIHWINDLPFFLKQVQNILKPDGVLLANMLGGTTLQELRYCFYLAEQERKGGISPHTSPLALPSDIAGLMQAAGYTLPTVDIDTITIGYPDALSLLEHIRNMGEGSASLNRHCSVGKDVFLAMASIYQELFGLEDGSVKATFQLINVIGWKRHETQPLPKRRGSAVKSLKDI